MGGVATYQRGVRVGADPASSRVEDGNFPDKPAYDMRPGRLQAPWTWSRGGWVQACRRRAQGGQKKEPAPFGTGSRCYPGSRALAPSAPPGRSLHLAGRLHGDEESVAMLVGVIVPVALVPVGAEGQVESVVLLRAPVVQVA